MINKAGLSQVFGMFFDPRAVLPFLFGALALAIMGNGAYDLLKSLVGDNPPDVIRIVVVAGLILVLAVIVLRSFLGRTQSDLQLTGKGNAPELAKGLILLISPRSELAKTAIQYHANRLEKCWLVCSKQSLEVAEGLRNDFPSIKIVDVVVNDVFDPKEFFNVICKISEEVPKEWDSQDVIGDYTGMTAHGSLGMAIACCRNGHRLQYIVPAAQDLQLRGIRASQPIEIELGIKWVSATRQSAGNPDTSA